MIKLLSFIAIIFGVSFATTAVKRPSGSIQTKDTVYYLIGQQQNFQLLFQAVNDPDNTTVNQRKALTHWIAGAKMLEQVPDSLSKPVKGGGK